MITHKAHATVLTIDDEPVIRESIAVYLEDSGFKVLQAENGKTGLAIFRGQKPDIVLVDLRMPEIDGLDVLAAVTRECPEIPIIVVSGTGILQDAIESLRLGAWDYLTKPIHDMAILEHAVRKALERASLMAENRRYRRNLEAEIRKQTAELKERSDSLEKINEQLQREMAERLRTEQALRESEERYRALFEDSPISLWEEDFSEFKTYLDNLRRQGVRRLRAYFNAYPEEVLRCAGMIRITDVNKATLSLFETSNKSDFLVPLNQILTEKSHTSFKEELLAVSGGKKFEIHKVCRTFKNNKLDILLKSSIPSGYEETWSKVFISVYDLTERIQAEFERKKLESQLYRAQKMEALGTLAGGVAHDFNNILSSVIGYTELTLDDMPEETRHRNNLESVLKAADRARELVSQILAFSRYSEQVLMPVQVSMMVKEALKLLRSSLPTSIEIRNNILDAGHVLADPIHIHQVIMNLCTNAFHAMQETGGILEVSLSPENIETPLIALDVELPAGPYARLTVRDTGHGMTPEIMERIFDPYFTTKETGKGTGLGLAVVHGIVKRHRGGVSVESTPGKGTTFTVWIPTVESVDAEKVSISDDLPTGNERVMLVDDETDIAGIISQLLERLGYRIQAYISSLDALDDFKADPYGFDVIITDMTMPNMTGDRLIAAMLKIRPDIPIVLCTGFSERINEEQALALGVKKFLIKPVSRKDMALAIRYALDS
jgi:CheY-like chemotaxis protein